MNPLFSGMGGLDPSKMTPETIGALTELMSTLSHAQMMKMQSIMHNSMAGFDVTKDMAEFESSLAPGFREKMARIMYMANGIAVPTSELVTAHEPQAELKQNLETPHSMADARLVILNSVAQGMLSPQDALKVLFPEQDQNS